MMKLYSNVGSAITLIKTAIDTKYSAEPVKPIPSLENLYFLNYHPEIESLRNNVLTGLASYPKKIASKFLYDKRGSELFDEICRQPEYYQTSAEIEILEAYAPEMIEYSKGKLLLIEFGSGSCRKIRSLLNHMPSQSLFIPFDISGDYLLDQAKKTAESYPHIEVTAICGDFLLPTNLPQHFDVADSRVLYFPGSTLGNFEPATQARILRNASQLVGKGGQLLIGLDRKNSRTVLEAAYNDKAGVTADFELNLLTHINRELGADFDLEKFFYRGAYNESFGRVEMYLVSSIPQTVSIEGRKFDFAEGETIHVENSYKFEPAEFAAFSHSNGLKVNQYWSDHTNRFCVYSLEVT